MNKIIVKQNYNFSKYKYIFHKNKKKSILLISYYYYHFYNIIFNLINLQKLLKNTTNNILYISKNNETSQKKNQFIDAIYNKLNKCNFNFINLNNYKIRCNNFINKNDYIFISNITINSENLIKILIIIFLYQNINGTATLIINNIDNNLLMHLLYILSKKYKNIYLLTKKLDLLTNYKYNKYIITLKNFKGYDFHHTCKLYNKLYNKNINNKIKLLKKFFNINNNDDELYIFFNNLKKWKKILNLKIKKYNNIIKNKSYNKIYIKSQINYCIYYCKKFNLQIKTYFLLFWNNKYCVNQIKSSNSNILYYFPKKYNINYSELQISNIGKFSITPNKDSFKIANIISNNIKKYNLNTITLTDATCGNGGNTIHFSLIFDKIIAIDKCPIHCDITQNNINVYNLKNVTIMNKNYLQIFNLIKQDIIFIDPPWGGPSYKKYKNIKLYLNNIEISNIAFNIIKNKYAKLIAIKIPYNYDLYNFYKKLNYNKIYTINLQKCKLIILNTI